MTAKMSGGLLYQKDSDSSDFPMTEIKRALKAFVRRRDLAGLEPALVYIHPGQESGLDRQQLAALGLVVEVAKEVPRNYICLAGRMK
ncbi:MAG: hypothetical protein HS126_02960 [Anaerolineales bacterium]|nr:hypothetical protein [Anaerolineales bacterium]